VRYLLQAERGQILDLERYLAAALVRLGRGGNVLCPVPVHIPIRQVRDEASPRDATFQSFGLTLADQRCRSILFVNIILRDRFFFCRGFPDYFVPFIL
jgi:hypothetical protein